MGKMNTKKLTLASLLIICTYALFAQLNPIIGLNYEQNYWYGNSFCPSYNCFDLSWEPPAASIDTLIGYKLFKEGEFWFFTTVNSVECSGVGPCEYSDFYNNIPFCIKVKAVYNRDSVLSVANDSVCVNDIMIGVTETTGDEICLLSNVIIAGECISVLIPDIIGFKYNLQVLSLNGQIIKEIENDIGGIITFSSQDLTSGIYIISIRHDGKITNEKLIVK